jgi:transcriptional regulator GlxA family with amidase domain
LHFSPKDQILNIRLERVRQLLVDTTDSVEQIARRVGLAGAAQLAALFKHRTGQTPGEFRERPRVASMIKD